MSFDEMQHRQLTDAENRRPTEPADGWIDDDMQAAQNERDALDGVLKSCGIRDGMKAIDENAEDWYWLKAILLEN